MAKTEQKIGFRVGRKELREVLVEVRPVVPKNSPQLVLNHIRLKHEGGKLTITSCDGSMWIAAVTYAEGSDVDVLIRFGILYDIVSGVPDGDIEFECDGDTVKIAQGKSSFKIRCMPAESYPEPPSVSGSTFRLDPADLDCVICAASKDPHRPILTGVQFAENNIVATDTHRLHVLESECCVPALIPAHVIAALSGPATVTIGEKFCEFVVGTTTITSSLLSGVYPSWERAVPSEYTRKWTVNRDALLEAVARSMVFAGDAKRIRLTGDGESLVVSARGDESGECKHDIPMTPSNGDLEIALNGVYLQQALKAMPESVEIELTENTRPLVLNGGKIKCVIMPMVLA